MIKSKATVGDAVNIYSERPLPRRGFLTAALFSVAAGFGIHSYDAKPDKNTAKAIESLSTLIWWDLYQYKVDRHLEAAIQLQALGSAVACDVLTSFAQKIRKDEMHHLHREESLIALIRMLFVKRPDSEFRRARIGAPAFFGGTDLDTDFDNWPLEPIEIIDGVPFCVVNGYMLAGEAEPASMYLEYCLENCDWNPYKFELKSAAQKQDALNNLLASPKFVSPLSDWDRKLLSDQIR